MSIMGKHVPAPLLGVAIACLIVGGLIPVMTRSDVREIDLVARNMAFYLADDPQTPNPTIVLKPGESVRFVLRNEDVGIRHDFTAPALSTSIRLLRHGEVGDALATVPARPGTYDYVCGPHRAMMRGRIVVANRVASRADAARADAARDCPSRQQPQPRTRKRLWASESPTAPAFQSSTLVSSSRRPRIEATVACVPGGGTDRVR